MAGKKRKPVVKMPERNPVPRRPVVKESYEVFARVYAETLDADKALLQAGYEFSSVEAKRSVKSRLLRTASVMTIIDEIRAKAVSASALTAEYVIERYRLVYVEAMRSRDWASAVNALRDLAKHLGLFEKHNRQKSYTQADAEKLRTELEAAGLDFTRVALVVPDAPALPPGESA